MNDARGVGDEIEGGADDAELDLGGVGRDRRVAGGKGGEVDVLGGERGMEGGDRGDGIAGAAPFAGG